jgi:hypothetical protein
VELPFGSSFLLSERLLSRRRDGLRPAVRVCYLSGGEQFAPHFIRGKEGERTREGKREAFLRRPIVEPAQPEQGPCVYECSAEAFQERQKILAEERKKEPNNPMLKFLPIERKFMSQAELEEAINQRPDTDYRFNLSKRGRYSTRPEQQQQQEEEEENEFDGIQLLWIEPESSEQLKF